MMMMTTMVTTIDYDDLDDDGDDNDVTVTVWRSCADPRIKEQMVSLLLT